VATVVLVLLNIWLPYMCSNLLTLQQHMVTRVFVLSEIVLFCIVYILDHVIGFP